MCAARSGQLLNLTALGAECGLSATTAREWLSVLEASYLVMRLQPHHENFGKRLVKSPKLYFLDVGLMAWLLGIRDTNTLDKVLCAYLLPFNGSQLFQLLMQNIKLAEDFFLTKEQTQD